MLQSKTNRIILFVSAFFVVALILFAMLRDNAQNITLNQMQHLLKQKSITEVIASKEYVYIKTQNGLYKIASSQVTPEMFVNQKVEVQSGSQVIIILLVLILLLGIGSLAYRWWQKRSEPREVLRSNTSESTQGLDACAPVQAIKSDVTFEDIGGISEVKIELEEIIDFMQNPKRYKSFGARMPRGVLLVGPPGVGKTMIAKAVANAAGVPFYYQSGASFVQIYVGMGAKRVHELFMAAKNNTPSIIFIDEIDAVGKKRDGNRSDEREATLNQLLTEMDGFEGSAGVIVLAATNKIDILDSALLRAGRFDRRVFVELPTKKERASILGKYLQKIPNDVDLEAVANMTVGFNGAALAALANEAALLSLRQHDFQVSLEHFHQVKDKVMFGKKKLQMLNDEQKKYRITYQAAKVVCATYYDLPFEKLLLSSEKLTPSTSEPLLKHEIESRIKMLLAGIAACSIKFNEHSSGVKDDLQEAKELTKNMCYEYGMGASLLAAQDEEKVLMQDLYTQTKKLLESMQSVVEKVELVLFERESITKEEVKKYINEIF